MQNQLPSFDNNILIATLVKRLYSDFTYMRDDQGKLHLIFLHRYRDKKIYFTLDGTLILYRSLIADCLMSNSANIRRTILRLEQAGFFIEKSNNVFRFEIKISGNNQQGPVVFYSAYSINLIASRFTKPSPGALNFLQFIEDMRTKHQTILADILENYRRTQEGINDQISQLEQENKMTSQALLEAKSNLSLSENRLALTKTQMLQLKEELRHLQDRLALAANTATDENISRIFAQISQLERKNQELETENLLLRDVRIAKARLADERAAQKLNREENLE